MHFTSLRLFSNSCLLCPDCSRSQHSITLAMALDQSQLNHWRQPISTMAAASATVANAPPPLSHSPHVAAAAATPLPGVTILYSTLSHIMQAILDASDRSTLLAARATCRSMRRDVDARLFRHTALTAELVDLSSPSALPPGHAGAWDGGGHARVSLREPDAPFRFLPWIPRLVSLVRASFIWSEVFAPSDSEDDVVSTTVICSHSATSQYTTANRLAPWPGAVVLDVYGIPPARPLEEEQLQLRGLKYLRDGAVNLGAHYAIAAPCIVRYPRPPGFGPTESQIETVGRCGQHPATGDDAQQANRMDIVVVVHPRWPTSSAELGKSWGMVPSPGGGVREIVYVFPDPSDPSYDLVVRHASIHVRFLWDALVESFSISHRPHITLVGLENQLNSSKLRGEDKDIVVQRMLDSQLRMMENRIIRLYPDADSALVRSFVRLQRLDEWRAQLDLDPVVIQPMLSMPSSAWRSKVAHTDVHDVLRRSCRGWCKGGCPWNDTPVEVLKRTIPWSDEL